LASVKGSMEQEGAVSNISIVFTHTRASASGTHVGELSMMVSAVAREQYHVKIQQHAQLARGRKDSALCGWRAAGGVHTLYVIGPTLRRKLVDQPARLSRICC
jgi:hypothetical protein